MIQMMNINFFAMPFSNHVVFQLIVARVNTKTSLNGHLNIHFFSRQISVSPDSRNTSWVSFDGRNRQELFHGDR